MFQFCFLWFGIRFVLRLRFQYLDKLVKRSTGVVGSKNNRRNGEKSPRLVALLYSDSFRRVPRQREWARPNTILAGSAQVMRNQLTETYSVAKWARKYKLACFLWPYIINIGVSEDGGERNNKNSKIRRCDNCDSLYPIFLDTFITWRLRMNDFCKIWNLDFFDIYVWFFSMTDAYFSNHPYMPSPTPRYSLIKLSIYSSPLWLINQGRWSRRLEIMLLELGWTIS